MIIRANIVANTSNSAVILDSVAGIVREDVFVSNIVFRNRNARVLQTFSSNNVVLLNQNVSITVGNTVQFQKLVTGNGLIASKSRVSYFLQDKPSYDPSADPRLPKATTLAVDLAEDATNVTVNGTTMSLGLSPILTPKNSTQNRYDANVAFSSITDIQVGDYVLGGANLTLSSNVRVAWVGNANTYIGFNKPIVAAAGQTFLFRRPVQPSLRVGSETIFYTNLSLGNNTITMQDCVRNIANTRPLNQTVTTLSVASSGAVLRLTDTTGVALLDYVLINNSTLASNVRVLWLPTGEGNANVGINAGISADAGTEVKFQRPFNWAANTTVSILGSIPL